MIGFLVLFAGLLGLAVGSFLNVVIHRVPRGASIVRPPSACPSCNTPIRGLDNIPVLSFLILRGRCRSCGAPISVRYPLVEAVNGALWITAAIWTDDLEEALFVGVFASALLALALIDLEHRRLPNAIVLPGIAFAVVWVGTTAAVDGDGRLLVEALFCGAAFFALLFVIAFVSGGMGFGDVKLAALLGVATGRFGWEVTVAAVFLAFMIGGLVAIVLLLSGRAGRKAAIPFGPSLAAGALLAIFVGPGPVRAWLNL